MPSSVGRFNYSASRSNSSITTIKEKLNVNEDIIIQIDEPF
jgi:CRISPR/Cas system-associated protein Csx1